MLSRDHVDQSAGSGSCFVGIVFSPIRGIRQVVVEVLIVLEFRIGLRKGGDQPVQSVAEQAWMSMSQSALVSSFFDEFFMESPPEL